MTNDERSTNREAEIASFFAKYEPAIAKLGKALRAKLRARLPGLHEIVYVYENQGSLVISYSPTERGSDGVSGVAVYPDRVTVFFGRGAELSKSDPNKLLQGSGKTVRHVAIQKPADFDRAEIEGFIATSLKLAKLDLDPRAKGSTIVKAEEQKQRAKRAAKAARPSAAKATRPAATRRKPRSGS